MVTTREIAAELVREVLRPQFIHGTVCAASVVAAMFPLIYCTPCGAYPRWLSTLSLTGFALWVPTSLFGVSADYKSDTRIGYGVMLLFAPLAYFFMFLGHVSH
jgi:hypothetical protein